MNTLRYLVLILMISITLPVQGKEQFDIKVKEAITRQLEVYPVSTLKDIYKNFFQDKFGPGHLIHDPVAAGNYLQRELNSMTESSGELIEPTGWEGNFYRINLTLIKDGIIPYDLFFDLFVQSVNNIKPVSIEEWEQEWIKIESIIEMMVLNLPDYSKDKQEIRERLQQGEYVGHHSELFEKNYSPHYRIIDKAIFESELLPLLNNYLQNNL